MIDYPRKELFLMDSVDKQLNISYDGGEITNSELMSEDFTLTDKLTSKGDIVLGECNAAYVEFNVGYGTDPLEGKKLTINTTPHDGPAFKFGEFTVVSDKPTADRRFRKIVAYDDMQKILNEDVTEWFNTLLPNTTTSITLKQFRDSFFQRVGVTQEEVNLINDAVVLTRMADFKTLTGKAVVNAICEINGCFGHVDRDSVFRYMFLHSAVEPIYPSLNLYPSENLFPKASGNPIEIGIGYRYKYPLPKLVLPSENLFPSEELYPVDYTTESVDGLYMDANYESYFTSEIKSIQIRNDKNDIGVTVGEGTVYIIEGNFLAYGQTTEVLTSIARNILSVVEGIYYRPASITAQGNPMLQVGDPIVLHTRFDTVETIIFHRKLKGIQFLIDTYTSKGQKELKSNLNSQSKKISDVDGKVNEVKADLVTANKVITDELEAQSARIGHIEADYITTSQLNAVDAKIDNLSAIAITTQNLSAQSINADQITAGIISVNHLDMNGILSSLAVNSVTVAALDVTGVSILGGYMCYWIYDNDLGQYVLCGSPE